MNIKLCVTDTIRKNRVIAQFVFFMHKWWFVIGFFLILGLAIYIDIAGVFGKGFWLDEILTMRVHAPRMAYWHFPYNRALNAWLAYKLGSCTSSELIIRLPNIIASLCVVAILGVWMRRVFGKAFSLVVMLCLTLAACYVRSTCLCRSYGFLAFFVILACWSCWEWTHKPKSWYWILCFFFGRCWNSCV